MKLTKNTAREIESALEMLVDDPDVRNSYGITEEQAQEIYNSIPRKAGEWNVPAWANEIIYGELTARASHLEDQAGDAYDSDERNEARRIQRNASKMNEIAGMFK